MKMCILPLPDVVDDRWQRSVCSYLLQMKYLGMQVARETDIYDNLFIIFVVQCL